MFYTSFFHCSGIAERMGNNLSQEDLNWIEQKTGVSEKMISRAYTDYRYNVYDLVSVNLLNFVISEFSTSLFNVNYSMACIKNSAV